METSSSETSGLGCANNHSSRTLSVSERFRSSGEWPFADPPTYSFAWLGGFCSGRPKDSRASIASVRMRFHSSDLRTACSVQCCDPPRVNSERILLMRSRHESWPVVSSDRKLLRATSASGRNRVRVRQLYRQNSAADPFGFQVGRQAAEWSALTARIFRVDQPFALHELTIV
jgi:hypothetical protein